MEDTQNTNQLVADNEMLSFDAPKDQSSYIKVIGVGGGGGNAVNHMYRKGIKGVDFIVCNTDMKALNDSPVPNKIMLGKLGAGGRPEVAKNAALACESEIRECLSHNTQMLFITAGMGGGTGTGAAPVIAEIAKKIELDDPDINKILTIAIVTMPFTFEGLKKLRTAEAGLAELRKHVDSLLIINNDKLMTVGGDLSLMDAFSLADDVLLTAAKGIAEIITASAYVNLDFHDVYTVMKESGTALMGSGIGKGPNRAIEAIDHATSSVLLNDNDISGAKSVLLYLTCSKEHPIMMSELGEITDRIIELTGNMEAEVFWGTGNDDSLDEELCITLIATGFEKRIQVPGAKTTITVLKEDDVNARKQIINPQAVSSDLTGMGTVKSTLPERPSMEPVMPVIEVVSHFNEPQVEDKFEAEGAEAATTGKHIYTLDDIQEEPTAETEDEVVNEEPVAETNEEPVAKVEEEIVAETEEEPAANTDFEPFMKTTETPSAEKDVKFQPEFDFMDIKNEQPQTVVEATPVATIAQPEPTQSLHTTQTDAVNNTTVMSRMERIKLMHDMLHNNPNGARLAEEMTPKEMVGYDVYETPHSSESDAARTTINHDGSVNRPNNYLFGEMPD